MSVQWKQLGFDIEGEDAGDVSGRSTAINSNGDIIAIGSPLNDNNGVDSGSVRVFKFNDTTSTWEQLGQTINGESTNDQSGVSVSLDSSGLILAIGAHLNDDSPNDNVGHVRVFRFNGIAWVQLGFDILGENAEDQSGFSVSLSGDGKTLVIGSHKYDGSPVLMDRGSVRIFVYDENNNEWNKIGQTIEGDNEEDEFGYSVNISKDGKRVVVGIRSFDAPSPASPVDNDRGLVRVYEYNSSFLKWVKVGQDLIGEADDDQSGNSVSINCDGTIIAIGASFNDNSNGVDSGHVRVYQYDSPQDLWVQLGSDIDGRFAMDRSGFSVSLNGKGDRVAIGSILADSVGGTNSGRVRVFRFVNNNWTQLGTDINGQAPGDQNGFSLELNEKGDRVVVGSIFNKGLNMLPNKGNARVFYLLDTIPPIITIKGSSLVTVQLCDTYTDEGATALDNVDGDLTSKIITTNNVDTSKTGSYTVTYEVEDCAGNKATKTRIVNVSSRKRSILIGFIIIGTLTILATIFSIISLIQEGISPSALLFSILIGLIALLNYLLAFVIQ